MGVKATIQTKPTNLQDQSGTKILDKVKYLGIHSSLNLFWE